MYMYYKHCHWATAHLQLIIIIIVIIILQTLLALFSSVLTYPLISDLELSIIKCQIARILKLLNM